MEIFLQPENWVALLTLTFLEIVLGVDNIIFISLVTNRLPEKLRPQARNSGLALALIFRVALLFGITWLVGLTKPLIEVPMLFGEEAYIGLSGRDLILLAGGVFLIAKSTSEIHSKVSKLINHDKKLKHKEKISFSGTIIQIVILDIVFSFDSILTAVGLTKILALMIFAVIISMGIMMIFSGKIADLINSYPTLQILALAFLILIGFTLATEAFHIELPKGYIYFAVFFSLVVEIINIALRKKSN